MKKVYLNSKEIAVIHNCLFAFKTQLGSVSASAPVVNSLLQKFGDLVDNSNSFSHEKEQ